MKVGDIIAQLMPDGASPLPEDDYPNWPPDAFAVAATLVNLSGTYSHPRFMSGWDGKSYEFDGAFRREVKTAGDAWRRDGEIPEAAKKYWDELLKAGDEPVACAPAKLARWQKAAIRLMAIADEACFNIGFAPIEDDPDAVSAVAYELMCEQQEKEEPPAGLPHAPNSLCRMVPPQAACVQPKTSTPAVGCTLRSLTHNLALLPPTTAVETRWVVAHPEDRQPRDEQRPLNLLLVPLPYSISGNDFVPVAERPEPRNRYFGLDPSWLKRNGRRIDARTIAAFIAKLVEAARFETPAIHGVVLPETALFAKQAEAVAVELADKVPGLELFVTGVIDDRDPAAPRNCAATYRIFGKEIFFHWAQAKHHRWRLEESQIKRYHIGHTLDPTCNWWERIDVGNRTCHFTVVRRRTSLAVLICEDLARVDPVLPVINAVGPTLVIALLMDGPQLERRWPGRYATVLAEDPGSSVLTLTSIGMIRRSTESGSPELRAIALWKEPDGVARELHVAPGHHGLLVSLTPKIQTQVTLDTRSENNETCRLSLSAARSVRIAAAKAEDWPGAP